jgi:hypothetical protein
MERNHMKLRLIGALATGAVALAAASSASAMVWTSNLEFKDAGNGAYSQGGPFGTVTIEDGLDFGKTVSVTVSLANPNSLFVNTGGPHDPFLYNLVNAANVEVINGPDQNFYDGGRTNPGAFQATPFGNFTNKIGCCSTLVPDQNVVTGFHFVGSGRNKVKVLDYTFVPAHLVENNGSANGIKGPLTFFLHDANGISFAGNNALIDQQTGKLVTPGGTDNHFFSNAGGWWFTADICDANVSDRSACTSNVAAKDAFTSVGGGVPEPATWALMILGFGSAGAMLRRRRTAAAVA